jgi:hypothetical protein
MATKLLLIFVEERYACYDCCLKYGSDGTRGVTVFDSL